MLSMLKNILIVLFSFDSKSTVIPQYTLTCKISTADAVSQQINSICEIGELPNNLNTLGKLY